MSPSFHAYSSGSLNPFFKTSLFKGVHQFFYSQLTRGPPLTGHRTARTSISRNSSRRGANIPGLQELCSPLQHALPLPPFLATEPLSWDAPPQPHRLQTRLLLFQGKRRIRPSPRAPSLLGALSPVYRAIPSLFPPFLTTAAARTNGVVFPPRSSSPAMEPPLPSFPPYLFRGESRPMFAPLQCPVLSAR